MSDFNLSLNPEDPLIKHAFRGTSFAVVRLEELNEIVNLKADAVACYRPANSQELFAVERIAISQQAIFRGYRLEAGLFTTALDYCLEQSGRAFRPMTPDLIGDGDIEITRAQNRNYAAGEGVRQMSIDSDVWTLLIRYQVNADRQYRRAIEDYERVKRLRPEMPNQPVDPKPENIGEDLASFTELGHSHLDRQPPVAPAPPPSGHSHPQPVPAQPVTTTPADLTPTAKLSRALPGTSRVNAHGLRLVPATAVRESHDIRTPRRPSLKRAAVRRSETPRRNSSAHACRRPSTNPIA